MIENAVYQPSEADVTFLGINYYGTCGVKGQGPSLIRKAVNSFSSYDLTTRKDSFDEIKISDAGNVNADTYDELRKKVMNKLLNINGTPIIMGGEHLVTLPVIEALKPENVLILDAHADFYDEYMGNANSYATVIRRISELAKNVLIAGVRDVAQEESMALDKAKNVELVKLEDLPKKMRGGDWYVSIDLDVLDPIFCPEVSTPVPMGIDYKSLVKVLNTVCVSHRIIGLDVVELTAQRAGLSSINAGGIIMNYLKRRCG